MEQKMQFPSPEELLAQYRAGVEEQLRAGRREVLRIDVTLTDHIREEPEPGCGSAAWCSPARQTSSVGGTARSNAYAPITGWKAAILPEQPAVSIS